MQPTLPQPDPAHDPGRRIDRVALIGVVLLTLLLAGVVVRVGQLQLAPAPALADAIQSRETRRSVPAVRGSIIDRRLRPLATTEFGYRVFVDPMDFPQEPDEAISRIADAVGVPREAIGGVLIPRLAENERRKALRESMRVSAAPGLEGMLPLAVLDAADPEVALGPADEVPDAAPPLPRLIRYIRVTDIIPDKAVEAVKSLRIPGVHLELRSVRAYPGGDLAASVIGKVGIEHNGLLGAEKTRDGMLKGEDGRMVYVRDVSGRPLWMSPGAFEPPQPGTDLRVSIDLELQRIATDELLRGVNDADAAGGRLVMMDPATGEIVAMVDILRPVPNAVPFNWDDAPPAAPGSPRPRYRVISPDPGRDIHPALGRNRCVEEVYEPGSTFKPFVWATVTGLGKARPEEVFDTEGGRWRTAYGRAIEDVVKAPTMRWDEVLINSSNIGMTKGAERVSFRQLHDAVRALGFGQKTTLSLPGETGGFVTQFKDWGKYTQTSVAFGYELAVTPVQMVRAFSAFARTGEAAGTIPIARLTVPTAAERNSEVLNRVLAPRAAALTREALRHVAAKMEAQMARAYPGEKSWRYTIFGKSGTAKIAMGRPPEGRRRPRGSNGYFDKQYNSSFIAGGPAEQPRLVVLVVIDDPGPDRVAKATYYGSHVAGPVVRRVLERSLAYLGVSPSPSAAPARYAPGSGAD